MCKTSNCCDPATIGIGAGVAGTIVVGALTAGQVMRQLPSITEILAWACAGVFAVSIVLGVIVLRILIAGRRTERRTSVRAGEYAALGACRRAALTRQGAGDWETPVLLSEYSSDPRIPRSAALTTGSGNTSDDTAPIFLFVSESGQPEERAIPVRIRP